MGYLCTSRLNQDPLEMYFSCIRQRGGWNNNLSASQFRHAYRKTLVHAVVACSMNANATPQLEGICLPRSQAHANGFFTAQSDDEGNACMSTHCSTGQPTATLTEAVINHDYFALSEYSGEVVQYIGGFVVRSLTKKLSCAECAALLVSDTVHSLFTTLKDNGGLIEPSKFVHAALHASECVMRQHTDVHEESIETLTLKAFQEFAHLNTNMLQQIHHYHEELQHIINLAKVLQAKYAALRLRAIGRRITEQSRGAYIRHVMTKRILFLHQ
ncbi:hypothetical protein HPB49_003747 [Dermacentor silvarum]|uniref:Uncharacterized protein n=1 Tax=Dermacentor silvarum TaxID=543639 RepID=A0ACB8CD79_DERSI|nr:hypothetical protein HPB49_003747 [Dermacentor silvarum]